MKKRERLETKARAGDAEAQYQLARYYWNLKPARRRTAIRWATRAAEQGHGQAQLRLGCSLMNGCGVRPDREAGFMWLRRAAAQGIPAAQFALGEALYDYGETEADSTESWRWFVRAAR